MRYGIRRALVHVTVVLFVGWFVSGCSGAASNSGAVGTSGQADSAAIGVQMTSGFITVENRTERPLVDTKLDLRAGALHYTAQLPRLAPGDKRDLSLGNFRGTADASPINVSLRRPNEILVTASDVDGKKYEVRMPWKQ